MHGAYNKSCMHGAYNKRALLLLSSGATTLHTLLKEYKAVGNVAPTLVYPRTTSLRTLPCASR